MTISFENTENAFAYKTNQDLRLAKLLFSTMGIGWLVKLGTKVTPVLMNIGLPIKGLIKKTIFTQFVGGETLEETSRVVEMLAKHHVQVILDYGVEGKEGEENFDKAAEEFINVIHYAASEPNIPFISVKLTGFARFSLLEKLHATADMAGVLQGTLVLPALNSNEQDEWERVCKRMRRICIAAVESNTGVLIDAEESWIQAPVDALTNQMMQEFNREEPVIYNTIQLYRHDRFSFLKETLAASGSDYLPGFKIVRGAYMEKERARAEAMNYPSPVQKDKGSTDADYNAAIDFCLAHISELAVIIASHNEESNLHATDTMEKLEISPAHSHVHFSQLYGMSDNITFNLAMAGCSVSKYLPFGPIEDVIPYLMRRAQENSSVSGQTGRQLSLIKKELARRSGK